MYYNSQPPVFMSARKLRISFFIIEFSIDRTIRRVYARDKVYASSRQGFKLCLPGRWEGSRQYRNSFINVV